ncbi:uncharacterized protein N7529_006287 [Penicillium soppii]|uniref:uncharacterized protein n=1 Tax=Penicillium soppii TaxID=69789 RepID=UPI00254679F9|nr:uncharacterized protein N7529_006287 [Penicillium soppii]KAJ5864371.1 hypothetical protein N7529_006287 [Penicillium soppii]
MSHHAHMYLHPNLGHLLPSPTAATDVRIAKRQTGIRSSTGSKMGPKVKCKHYNIALHGARAIALVCNGN